MLSLPVASDPVIVVGGGLSGLAAAVELSSANLPVLLLERKPKLGGRAYSFIDSGSGEVIDNGQHVLIAGYERTMRFLEKIGTKGQLVIQPRPELVFHHPRRGFCRFTLPKLPSPLHLAAGILSTDLFALRDKLRLLRAGLAIHFSSNDSSLDNTTIDDWLKSLGQSAETKSSFWDPLAVSIMNEHIAKASAKVFVNALNRAFFTRWNGASLAISRVGLSELFVDDAVQYVRHRGGEVRANSNVVGIQHESGRVVSVRCKDGYEASCCAVILAVPHFDITDVSKAHYAFAPGLADVESTPIVSIHLWFSADFMPQDVVGVIGKRIQWIFNKRNIQSTAGRGGHLSCVISGAAEFVDMSNAELIEMTLQDVISIYPAAATTYIRSVVIKEKRATFSCTPHTEKLRPSNHTNLENFFISGDWTNTGLPATIESAVISGEEGANLVKNYIDHVSNASAQQPEVNR